MGNLFAKAKSTATTKTTDKKDSKVRIDINDVDFFDKIQKFEELNDRMKSDKAKADMIADDLRYGPYTNFTLKHYEERVKIYSEEKFPFTTNNVRIN